MADAAYTDAEVAAAVQAVRELEDETTDRYLSLKTEVEVTLGAVLPAHDARVRAQAGEDAALAVEALDRRAAYADEEWICRAEAARIVREVTGASGEVFDGLVVPGQ